MTYVIAEPCAGQCDTACVEVCPVDCIHGPIEKDGRGEEVAELKAKGELTDDMMLYIDPDECIDCGACEPECPFEAIFEESELPEKWSEYLEKNAAFFR